jgi:hypothetical protein
MDSTEIADTELEARLRGHYESVYGEPGTSAAAWKAIVPQLGAQESRELVEFARSVSELYAPDGQPASGGLDSARRAGGRPAKGTMGRVRSLWSPALAAGLVLALVGTLVAVMTLSGRGWDRLLPGTSPDDGSQHVLEHIAVKNPGFEEGLTPWIKSSRPYQTNYSFGVDNEAAHSGSASAQIRSLQANPQGYATLAYGVEEVEQYQGKRLRWSGYLKTQTETTRDVEGTAALWMRVDGTIPELDPSQVTVLAADFMLDRPVIGSTDWQRYDVVLDVPQAAQHIVIGAALQGPGKVWIDDVSLEVVSTDVPTTEYSRGTAMQFENTGFENGLAGWHKYSQRFNAYEAGVDETVKHGGKTSGYLKAEDDSLDVPGEIGQRIRADVYRGQRVRLTGFLKTAGVEKGAGIGLGTGLLDGRQGPYDDMTTRLITGTNDWQKVEIVLDVPADTTTITMGAMLRGKGQVWVDDLQMKVVGNDVPTTGTTR